MIAFSAGGTEGLKAKIESLKAELAEAKGNACLEMAQVVARMRECNDNSDYWEDECAGAEKNLEAAKEALERAKKEKKTCEVMNRNLSQEVQKWKGETAVALEKLEMAETALRVAQQQITESAANPTADLYLQVENGSLITERDELVTKVREAQEYANNFASQYIKDNGPALESHYDGYYSNKYSEECRLLKLESENFVTQLRAEHDSYVARLRAEGLELLRKNGELSSRNETLQTLVDTQKLDLDLANSRLNSSDAISTEELHSTIVDLKAQRSELEVEVADLKIENLQLVAEKETVVEQAKAQSSESTRIITNLEANASIDRSELASVREMSGSTQEELEASKLKSASFEKDLVDAQSTLSTTRENLQDSVRSVQDLSSEVERLQKFQSESKDSILRLKSEVVVAQEDLKDLQGCLSSAKESMSVMGKAHEAVKEGLKEKNKELQAKRAESNRIILKLASRSRYMGPGPVPSYVLAQEAAQEAAVDELLAQSEKEKAEEQPTQRVMPPVYTLEDRDAILRDTKSDDGLKEWTRKEMIKGQLAFTPILQQEIVPEIEDSIPVVEAEIVEIISPSVPFVAVSGQRSIAMRFRLALVFLLAVGLLLGVMLTKVEPTASRPIALIGMTPAARITPPPIYPVPSATDILTETVVMHSVVVPTSTEITAFPFPDGFLPQLPLTLRMLLFGSRWASQTLYYWKVFEVAVLHRVSNFFARGG